jgi:NarL family two-component system sensor histidine kinase LiaS
MSGLEKPYKVRLVGKKAMIINQAVPPFRRLQWKLTLSYAAVTVGSLLIVVLILGYLLFSRAFIPLELYDSYLAPRDWIRIMRENSDPVWTEVLSEDPINTDLIARLLQYSSLQITNQDILKIGDFQIGMRTVGQGSALIVDPDGILLGTTTPDFVPESEVGQPLDMGILPGLEGPWEAALRGEIDPDRLFVTLEQHESFYFAYPILGDVNQEVLGVAIVHMEHLPTADDIPATLLALVGRSVLIFLLAAGVIGTLFGALTASGMVLRLERVSQVTDAWSQGDFSEFIEDPAGDEISRLAGRLNTMAEQLQQFIKRSQGMAISEERGRLARDLHDSAKQEALAASFHLGTALTLFESDPEGAQKHLMEAENLVDSVRGELTDLIHELRPFAMNGGRFDETLNEYLIEWAHQAGIGAELSVDGDVDLPLEIKQAIYRIMQEALANVARHSSAENVEVTLRIHDQGVEFTVQDDGMGFDPQGQHVGMGLDSMRERAEGLGGAFHIETAADQGTKVRVKFPFTDGRAG